MGERGRHPFFQPLQRSCKRQKVFRGTCSIPANAEKFFVTLAAFLQTPKSFSWHLQHSCKRQKIFRDACSVPANAKNFFVALAAFLQTPKIFLWHLQRSCKHFRKEKGFREALRYNDSERSATFPLYLCPV